MATLLRQRFGSAQPQFDARAVRERSEMSDPNNLATSDREEPSMAHRDTAEVIKRVREVFFFPPRRIWIGGKELELSQFGADDMIIIKED